MIAKKLPRRADLQKSCSAHVADIASYIRAAQEKIDQKLTGGAEPEKVLCKGALGFVFSDEDAQVAEMSARSTEAKNIPDHWVLSWQPDETPTELQLHEAAALFTKEMGIDGHHIIYAAHGNTQNVHLHLCISRVHPKTGKVIEINKGFDRIAAMRAICIIEHCQGWKQEQNPYFEMTINGPQRRENYKQGLSEKASLYETKTGNPSLERRVKALAPLVASATSWQDLHMKLAAEGMTYEKRRGGAIIKASDGSGFVKASKCAREASLAALEKRFGSPFEKAHLVPKPYEPAPPQIKRDMNLVDLVLALIFRLLGMQAEARAILYSRQSIERAELRQQKFSDLSTKWAAQSVLREEHAAQRQQLKNHYEMEAQKIKAMSPAELEIYCEKNKLFKGKTMDYATDFERIHIALGAEKYLLTAKDDNPGAEAPKTFIYKPFGFDKNQRFEGYTPAEVEKVLPELVKNEKSQRFGAYFTPIPAAGEHFITVDDINSQEKFEIAGKFSPAMISESSPGSKQMILKIHADSDPGIAKAAANRTAARINTLCGDPQIANGKQALRLPPFQNFKPKHQRDSVSPRARLIEAQGGFCEKAQAIYAEEVEKIKMELAPKTQQQDQGFTPDHGKTIRATIPTTTESGRGLSWSETYAATAVAVTQSMRRAGYEVPTGRRMDYAVACRLRVMGYDDGEATKILTLAREWNEDFRHGDTAPQDAQTEQTRAISTVLSAYHTEEGDKQHARLLPKKAAFLKEENGFIKLKAEENQQNAAQDQPVQQTTRHRRRR